MNRKMMARILDKRAIAICFFAISFLLLTNADNLSVDQLLGGVCSAKSRGTLDILGIIKWNLCVFPPVSVSILFMMSELGLLSRYTMLRSKSIKGWYCHRVIAIIGANFIYLLAFITITSILGLNNGCSHKLIFLLIAIFPIHTIMLSMISVMLFSLYKTPKPALIAFLVFEGGTVVIGSVFPQSSKYMVGFWGMVRNNLILPNSSVQISITIIAMLALSILSIIITAYQLESI